jgi:hypothetical protein
MAGISQFIKHLVTLLQSEECSLKNTSMEKRKEEKIIKKSNKVVTKE